MARLWAMHDGEPWMVNPALAVWANGNSPRRRRRRTSRKGGTMARRRSYARPRRRRRSHARRNGPFDSTLYTNRHRRRRRARRNYYSVVTNRPRRRRRYHHNPRRRRGFGGKGQAVNLNRLLPQIGAGVGAGLVLGYVTPMVVTRLGVVPSGPIYRLIQGAIAFGGAMLAQRFRLVGGAAANAFAAYGMTVAAIGLVNDLGLLQGLGLGAPTPVALAPASPAGTAGYMGYYESGGMLPYGQAGPARMSGYYRLED